MVPPRISLKWFLIISAAIAALVGTVGKRHYDDWQRRRWLMRQQQIAAELTALGCSTDMHDGKVVSASLKTGHTAKAVSLVEEATELQWLEISGCSDSVVLRLENHLKLRHLSIGGSDITDHSLRVIGRFAGLEHLTLAGAAVTDEGLAHLAGLKKLNGLRLLRLRIGEAGLGHIARLPELQYLLLSGCPVTDDDVAPLAACQKLYLLNLDYTKVTGPGLSHLAALPNLTSVSLAGTTIRSGEGLGKLRQVEQLLLDSATIGPGVIKHLGNMERLDQLIIRGARIPNGELAELERIQQVVSIRLKRRQKHPIPTPQPAVTKIP